MKTYYPQAALEGFSNAIASALGLSVNFAYGHGAYVDANGVTLPRITKPLDADEFTHVCGVAVHEVSHVYYRSLDFQEDYAKGDTLRRACMNAVVDVNDETRMESRLPGTTDLLRAVNAKADADNDAANAFTKGDPVWACLAAGILWNRIGQCRTYRAAKKSHPEFQKMLRAYRILKKAKHRSGASAGSRRSASQEARLTKVADDLVALLKSLGDASGAPCNQNQPGQSKPGMGQPGPAGIAVAGMGEGKGTPAPGDKLADEVDGERAACGVVVPGEAGDDEGEETPVQIPGTLGGSIHVPPGEPCRMNVELYSTLRPVLIGAVERMARHDHADGSEDGFLSGTTIGRGIERAMIDGHCFSRRTAEGENLNAVVLLDNSGSMNHCLPDVSAIAQAFADALAGVAKSVDLATFETNVMPRKHFRNVSEQGGTSTEEALKWANDAVTPKPGKRVAVVITDGDPADRHATMSECSALVSRGVHVIGVAYLVEPNAIQASMPGAQIIAANDPSSLALQLTRVAAQIASK